MIIELMLLLLGVPVGVLIASLTRDEMKQGKKYFMLLMIISLVGAILFLIAGISYITWTFGFMLIVSLISFVKSGAK